jgi:TonB family protein
MLEELVGSRPKRRVRPGPFAASATAHVALIAAALIATHSTGSPGRGRNRVLVDIARPVPVAVRYLTAAPLDDRAERRDDAKPAARPVRGSGPNSVEERREDARARFASLKTTLDSVTRGLADIHPAIDVGDMVRDREVGYDRAVVTADSEFNHGAVRLSDAVQPVAVPANGIYTPDLVDQQVQPRPDNPRPRYPEPMRMAGVEADVSVFFVVDTTGRVDEPSIKFATHVHELFMDAIRASLRRARFFPARLAGRVVPQLVQQEFRFEIRSQR